MQSYEIPNSAIRYILFQRSAYHVLTEGLLFKAIRKMVPSFNYHRMIGVEAKLRARRVKALYLADMEEEYRSVKEFLPENCSKILDIGCGIAGIDIFLNQHYVDRDIDFYLLDKNYVEDSVFYSFESKGAFYNSLDVARTTLIKNGIPKGNLHLVEATEENDIEIETRVDLVLSLISWGFHYPVSVYLERVYDLLDEGGVLILDIRRGTDGVDVLAKKFDDYRTVLETRKFIRICAIKSS